MSQTDERCLVLLRISKSCKRTDSDGFLKNPRIRTRIRILDDITMRLQTCGLVSVHHRTNGRVIVSYEP